MAAGAGKHKEQMAGTPLLVRAVHFLVALVLSLPLSTEIWEHLPRVQVPPLPGIAWDRALLLVAVLCLLLFLLRRLPLLSYAALTVFLAVITYRSFTGGAGLRGLMNEYGNSIASLSRNINALPEVKELQPFKGADQLRAAMNFTDPAVRSFAVRAATTWFGSEAQGSDRTMVQAFSVFKVINNGWIYVSDPADAEYFAKASESVPLLAGDCDDHAVLMASCIKAVGGRARLVRTTGHIYPELCVGNATGMERAAWLIRNMLFPNEAGTADLYYHTDANGDRWINLDYTRHYPGGPVMDEKIIGILHV